MSGRAAPFHCPYCGEERLVPRAGEGAWYCQDCVRSFKLTFLGVGVPQEAGEVRREHAAGEVRREHAAGEVRREHAAGVVRPQSEESSS
ncbi:hypothetical protein [Actinomadura harenae]|uniref:hypothetical protein n=1 Tax=Actinomadura harenae TaxID=2483351 RepID=UPI001F1DC538|nr:hypothetical protein [Actinomadura harenae]